MGFLHRFFDVFAKRSWRCFFLLLGLVLYPIYFVEAQGMLGGCGSQRGYPHLNGGGFVALTAKVDPDVFVSPDASVCGDSRVRKGSHILGQSSVDNSEISGRVIIAENAMVSNSRLSGEITIFKNAEVSDSVLSGDYRIDRNVWRNKVKARGRRGAAFPVDRLKINRGSGLNATRRGGLAVALIGAGMGLYNVLKDGVVSAREVQDQTMKSLDETLMTASVEASELHPDIASFNKLINQMHQTADYFIENNLPMSSRQRQSILVMLDQARDQFSGDKEPTHGISQIEKQRIYDQITDFRSKLQQIGRDHPQDAGSTQQKTTTGHR